MNTGFQYIICIGTFFYNGAKTVNIKGLLCKNGKMKNKDGNR